MWHSPPEPLELLDKTVDVWRLSLEQPPQVIERLARLLCDEETSRAARFHFERDQNCYTLTRATLRVLLGNYLDTSPQDIVFVTGDHGKPALSPSQQPSEPIEFNVSHSGVYSLLAFSRHRRVGVDVEHARRLESLEMIAEHHFSPSEFDAVLEGDEAERLASFYRCWTRKEAYMKATGEGISIGLKSFAVGVGESARLLWTDRGDAHRWQMAHIPAGDDYPGAVCFEGDASVEIRWFEVSARDL